MSKFKQYLANVLEDKIVSNIQSLSEMEFNQEPLKEFQIQDAEIVLDKLEIKNVTAKDLLVGMNVELEHGKINELTNITNDDPMMTAKIALIHIFERDDYYLRLNKYVEND